MLAHTHAARGVLSKIVVTPWFHMLQRADMSIVIGETAERGGSSSAAYAVQVDTNLQKSDATIVACALQEVAESSNMDETSVEYAVQRMAEQKNSIDADESQCEDFGARMLDRVKTLVPGLLGGVSLQKVTRGFRPMPMDGFPAIGYVEGSCATRPPRLYVCVMHSGVTLGPLAGALAALEIVHGVDADVLAEFRSVFLW